MLPYPNVVSNRLETSTKAGEYEYWLSQEDIADIARLQFGSYRPSDTTDSYKTFEIIGSPAQLHNQLQAFITKTDQINNVRLTLIINIDQLHWATLVVVNHNKNYAVYYIDSLHQGLPLNFQETLKNILPSPINDLSGYLRGQADDYNCGLWALENADDLTRMVDEQKGLFWMLQRLQRPRNTNYFTRLRLLLSLKLGADPIRKARIVQFEHRLPPLVQAADTRLSSILVSTRESFDESKPKKQKLLSEEEKVRESFEFFVKKFVQDFVRRLGAHSLLAKGERLTAEALKTELKTGITGALLGVAIARNVAGSIPSLVASLRIISSKYYTNKKMSEKITKAFSELKNVDLRGVLNKGVLNNRVPGGYSFVKV